jgi:hypothetical protein
MADIVGAIPFPPAMRDALVEGTGPLGALVDAAVACERGDFPSAEHAQLHMDATLWASAAADQLLERPRAAA